MANHINNKLRLIIVNHREMQEGERERKERETEIVRE